MIRVATGQVEWISQEEVYDKKRNKKKRRFALTVGNMIVPSRLEHIEFDLLDANMGLIEQTDMGVGDTVEVRYQDIGRVYCESGDDGEIRKYYQNKDCFDIKVI